jgi:hypothetical protein
MRNRDSLLYTNWLIRCIALRTMVTKDGVAYLQAGGGIVFGEFKVSAGRSSLTDDVSTRFCGE